MTFNLKITCAVALLSITTLVAQESKEEILPILANEICSCVDAKNLDFETAQVSEIEMHLGLCMIQAYGKHTKVVKNLYGNILENDASMESFATDIGVEMVSVCPEVIMAAAGEEFFEEEETYNEYSTSGSILNVEVEGKFKVIEFKEESGKRINLYWFSYFDGDENLYQNEKSIKAASYYIEYKEEELFDAQAEEYRIFKVITALSKK